MKQELFKIYERNLSFNIREEAKEISMLSNPNNYIIEKRNKDNILIGVSVIKNTGKILDCCCGVGGDMNNYLLGKNGFEVTGIDISPSQIETAKNTL